MLSGKLYGNYFTETVIVSSRVNVLLFKKTGTFAMEGSVRT